MVCLCLGWSAVAGLGIRWPAYIQDGQLAPKPVGKIV